MSGGTFNRQYPHFNLPNDWRVVYQSASGIVRPDATRTFLHAMARSRGARLLHDTPVLEVATHADTTRLRTAKEILTCDYLIVAAGSWLLKVLPQLEFPLRPERRVLAWFQPRIQTELCDGRVPIFCLNADGGWYGMPTPEGAIKIGHDKHLSQQIDPDKPSIEPSDEDADALKPCVQKYLTGFEPQTLAMKSCIYTLSQDRHFLMDRHPQHPQIFIFSCCSGHGFKYAPAYGEVAADMLSGKLQSETFSFSRGGIAASRFA
jgi:sarcosine oxidase